MATKRPVPGHQSLPPELRVDILAEPAEMKILLAVIEQAHVDARRTTPVPIGERPEFGDPKGWLADLQQNLSPIWNDRTPQWKRRRR
jgi:hypothetical protein